MRPLFVPALRRYQKYTLSREVYEETIERLSHLPPIADDRLILWLHQQRQSPSDPLPLYSIAQLAHEAGYEPYAQALRDFVIDCYPHVTAKAHLERGRQRIRRGEWDGWNESEWRWRDTEYLSYANRLSLANIPRWDGEAFGGSVMVLQEGGFGDALMMYRYLPNVLRRCKVVYVVCGPELSRLVERAYGQWSNLKIIQPSDKWPTFDRIIPMLSLPGMMGPLAPDLYLPQAALEFWYEAATSGRGASIDSAIGVAWVGRNQPDPRRSMPIECLAPLIDRGRLMSLLPAGANEAYNMVQQTEEAAVRSGRVISSLLWPMISDFADTARLIQHCSSVVTIDTAVAHLAGCLGVKTYLCAPYAACWRWGMGSESDWYPSIRIVRQSTPGEWNEVIGRVVGLME